MEVLECHKKTEVEIAHFLVLLVCFQKTDEEVSTLAKINLTCQNIGPS